MSYNETTRTLSIEPNKTITTLKGTGTIKKHSARKGQRFTYALYSDINVYFNGSWIPSCATNGYTMVKLEDLSNAAAGTSFTWDNGNRSAKLWVDWAKITTFRVLDEEIIPTQSYSPTPISIYRAWSLAVAAGMYEECYFVAQSDTHHYFTMTDSGGHVSPATEVYSVNKYTG